MTLRSAVGRTYQVVGSEGPAIEERLAELSTGSEVTVGLIRAHGRGNGWYVTAIETPAEPTAAAERLGPSSRCESQ